MQTQLNSAAKIANYHGPLLQSHGTADRLIPYAIGCRLFDAANQPKRFIPIPGGDHNDPQTGRILRGPGGVPGRVERLITPREKGRFAVFRSPTYHAGRGGNPRAITLRTPLPICHAVNGSGIFQPTLVGPISPMRKPMSEKDKASEPPNDSAMSCSRLLPSPAATTPCRSTFPSHIDSPATTDAEPSIGGPSSSASLCPVSPTGKLPRSSR